MLLETIQNASLIYTIYNTHAPMVKKLSAPGLLCNGNLPATQETWVQFLSWEDPMEKGMATHSSIPAWRIPMDRGAWWAAVYGVAKSRTQLND